MMLDKKILEVVKNYEIPYKWLVTYGDSHILDLPKGKLEGIFPDLYRWTKIAFRQKKSNAFSLLYNILWMDERINVLNWEYSNLEHYKKRLVLRFQSEKETVPVTVLSFLKGESVILDTLRTSLESGFLVFFEHPNTRDNSLYCQMDIETSGISSNDQKELMAILTERITDKIQYIDHLLSDKKEREEYFTVPEPSQELHLNILEENNPLFDTDVAPLPIDEPATPRNDWVTKQNDSELDLPLDNKTTTEEVQVVQPENEGQEDHIASLKKAIKGDGLLHRFLYLKMNVEIEAREGANFEVIKYSAIYFVLQREIADRKREPHKNDAQKEGKDWKIYKNKLGIALGIELITSEGKITDIHLKEVEKKLRLYEEKK